MPFPLLALVATVAVVALPWLLRPRFIPGVAHGRALPLLGNALDLIKHMRHSAILSDLFAERVTKPFGPLGQFMLSAFSPVLVIADLRLAEQVCRSADWDKGDMGRNIFGGLAPFGMLALSTDATLRLHRRALAPTMSAQFLRIAGDVFGLHTVTLIKLWQHRLAGGDGRGKEAFFSSEADIKALTTDAISAICFGESFGQLAPRLAALKDGVADRDALRGTAIAKHMTTLFESICGAGDVGGIRHWCRRQTPSYKRAYTGMLAYVTGQIATARRRLIGGGEVAEVGSVIDIVLLKEGKEGEGAFLPDAELIDELGTLLVTGEETTSTAICWLLKFLSENVEVQEKLYAELLPAMPSPDERPIGFLDVNAKLPYLEAVVHEVLRLGSVVRAVPRQASRDTAVIHPSSGDIVPISRGVKAIIMLHESCMVQSSDRKLGWAIDPTHFAPERWLDADGSFDGSAGPSIPFVVGPRSCFGAKMALTFLRVFAAQLILHFRLAPLPMTLLEDRCKAFITRRPVRNFVGPRDRRTGLTDDVVGIERQFLASAPSGPGDSGYVSRERSVELGADDGSPAISF